MKKNLAKMLCYMLWVALVSAIVLGILFFLEIVPVNRFLDIISISFFLALAGMTSRALDRGGKQKLSATFDYLFLVIAFTPIVMGRNYPVVFKGFAEWLLFLYAPFIALAVIVIAIARRNDKDEMFEECIAYMIIIAWAIFLGVGTWYSIMKGIYSSVGSMIWSVLAGATAIIIGFVICALAYYVIAAVKAIADLHRYAFGKDKGESD
jgi:hypothetical protein